MKASTLILSASVLLNLALFGTIGAGLATRAGADAGRTVKTAATIAPKPQPVAGPETWNTLQAPDLVTERDRLRAEGFPDNMIRAILGAQIRERYAAQRKAIEQTADVPYWKTFKPDPATSAALRNLAQAERKELRELLGPNPGDYDAERFKRLIPNLSDEKADALSAITQRYNEQRADLFRGGPMAPDDQEKMRALDKAAQAELATVLTPEELEQYDLRSSRTAMQLQYNLSAFNPSEAEYRALYRLQAAFDEQFGQMYVAPTPEEMKARTQAQRDLQDQIAAALGPDRYAQYQRATDYNYRETIKLVGRLELPPETADNLYAVQKEYQQKQQEVFKAVRGSPDGFATIQQQLTALQQEATTRVSTVFNGDAMAVEAYRRYGGQWLRNMVPSTGPRVSLEPR